MWAYSSVSGLRFSLVLQKMTPRMMKTTKTTMMMKKRATKKVKVMVTAKKITKCRRIGHCLAQSWDVLELCYAHSPARSAPFQLVPCLARVFDMVHVGR